MTIQNNFLKKVDNDRIMYLLYEVGMTKTQAIVYFFTVDKKMRLCDCMSLLGLSSEQCVYDAKQKAIKTYELNK